MLLDSTECVKGDKKAVTKGEDSRGETFKSGLFIFGVEWKVIQSFFFFLVLIILTAGCLSPRVGKLPCCA